MQAEFWVASLELRAVERAKCSSMCKRYRLGRAVARRNSLLLERFAAALQHGQRQRVAEVASQMDDAQVLWDAAALARRFGDRALAESIERLPPGRPPAECECPIEKEIRPLDMTVWWRNRAQKKATATRARPVPSSAAGVEQGVVQGAGPSTGPLLPPATSSGRATASARGDDAATVGQVAELQSPSETSLPSASLAAEGVPGDSSSSGAARQKKVANPFKVRRQQPGSSLGGRSYGRGRDGARASAKAPLGKRPLKQRTLLDLWTQ